MKSSTVLTLSVLILSFFATSCSKQAEPVIKVKQVKAQAQKPKKYVLPAIKDLVLGESTTCNNPSFWSQHGSKNLSCYDEKNKDNEVFRVYCANGDLKLKMIVTKKETKKVNVTCKSYEVWEN
jgi:hypothetical protein